MKKQYLKTGLLFLFILLADSYQKINAQCTYCLNQVYNYSSQWGGSGTGNGQFNSPRDMAIDASGNIYVSDNANNRVQKFNSSGTYVSQFGNLGTGNGQFNLPRGIAIDGSGNIFVADQDNNRIQKFNSG